MRRIAFAAVVAVILIGVLLVNPQDGSGCHGKCRRATLRSLLPGSPTPTAALLGPGGDGTTNQLLGSALLTADGRRLYLIRIIIKPGAESDSYIDPGETDAFYVQSGTIEFDVEGAATHNGKRRIGAGNALFLDRQSTAVSVTYRNVGRVPAVVVISAAPPAASAAATPTP